MVCAQGSLAKGARQFVTSLIQLLLVWLGGVLMGVCGMTLN